ncbi:MAG: hypothetical protein K8R23_08925 [Chthoniobacter sp.]|nr:hypothetical protein [Chthoniobacter sp.]
MVVIDLAGGSLQITVVVEPLQTAEYLLTAAADEFGDVVRTQKAVPIDHAKNLRVPRRQSHWDEIFCASKARIAGEHHPLILAQRHVEKDSRQAHRTLCKEPHRNE